jgi:hypothetical protein
VGKCNVLSATSAQQRFLLIIRNVVNNVSHRDEMQLHYDHPHKTQSEQFRHSPIATTQRRSTGFRTSTRIRSPACHLACARKEIPVLPGKMSSYC